MKKAFIVLFIFQILFSAGCKPKQLTPAQRLARQEKEQKNVAKLEMPDFTFTPYTISPEFGISHSLMCLDCNIIINQKHIEANLPYLGHFYIQPTSLHWDVPIRFISDKFVYAITYLQDNNTYSIMLKPEDAGSIMNDNITFNFLIKPDGSGTLTVKSDNRDEISYDGLIR